MTSGSKWAAAAAKQHSTSLPNTAVVTYAGSNNKPKLQKALQTYRTICRATLDTLAGDRPVLDTPSAVTPGRCAPHVGLTGCGKAGLNTDGLAQRQAVLSVLI